MSFSSGSSFHEVILQQLGGTSDHGRPAMLRQLCSATSPHNNNTVAVSNVLAAILSSWGPNILSGSLHGHIRTQPNNASAFALAVNVIRAQFLQYRRRIHALEAEVEDLRHDNIMYHSDVGALESELSNMRVNYYTEVSQRHKYEELAKKDHETIKNLHTEIAVLKKKNALAEQEKDENNFLKAENGILKAEIDALRSTHSRADLLKCEEVRALKAVLEEERSQAELDGYEIKLLKAEVDILREDHCRAELDKCEIKLLKAEITSLKEEHTQAEHFIRAMVDIKAYDSVLSGAARAVLDGGDAEDVLVEAVKLASSRKGSPWSRIIPAVVGPRAPEHYLSAIEIALRARKELQERRKVANFWKFTALASSANVGIITPSSSQISDICDEMIKGQRCPDIKEPHPIEPTVVPVAAADENLPPTTVTAEISAIEPSHPDSICEMAERHFGSLASVQTESTQTIKLSTPTSALHWNGFVDQHTEDQTYAPAEETSAEAIEPLISAIETTQVITEDIGESFTVVEQSIKPVEDGTTLVESITKSEVVFLPESKVISESVLQSVELLQQCTHSHSNNDNFPASTIQHEDAAPSDVTIADREPQPSSPSFSERPTTPIRSITASHITTPSKLSRPSSTKSKSATPVLDRSRPRLVSPLKSPSPNKFLKSSRVAEFLQTSRKNSELFVKPLKAVGRPTSPIRSRLSTPKNHALKRPVLQTLNLNVPVSATKAQKAKEAEKNTRSTVNLESVGRQILPKPINKDIRKRRGVIMIERVDIDGPLNKDKATKAPYESQGKVQYKVQDMPRLPSSVSTDVFSDPSNVKSKQGDLQMSLESKSTDAIKLKAGNDSEFLSPSPSPEVQLANQDRKPVIAVSFATKVDSRLVEQFSDSDLGSLETSSMDEDSDSDCEDIRRIQVEIDDRPLDLTVLPHIKRALAEENYQIMNQRIDAKDVNDGSSHKTTENHDVSFGSASVAPAPGLSTPRTSRPATPFSKSPSLSLDINDNERLSPSTSGSSYTTSSSGSVSIPAKKASRLPLLGLSQHLRAGNGSIRPSNSTTTPSFLPLAMARTQLPSLGASSAEGDKTLVYSAKKPSTKPLVGNLDTRNKASVSPSDDATPLTPPKKVIPSISAPSKNASSMPSGTRHQRTPSVAEKNFSQSSMGHSFIRRLSNSPLSKLKPNSTTQSVKTDITHLAPPTSPPSPGSLTKPRSHTINTVSPLPPTLSTPSPEALRAKSTKPRSHTVNSYSPTTRSPLSRLVADASAEYNGNLTPTKDTRSNQHSPPIKSLAPKSSPPPRTGVATSKSPGSPSPLRVRDKSSSIKRQGSQSSEEVTPAPPTAAFMRPAVSPASNTKRMTNSIAPLIPNWSPATANGGGLTPKQCRSMFRNSLSMVVR